MCVCVWVCVCVCVDGGAALSRLAHPPRPRRGGQEEEKEKKGVGKEVGGALPRGSLPLTAVRV